jgi:copper(I)-binding protein
MEAAKKVQSQMAAFRVSTMAITGVAVAALLLGAALFARSLGDGPGSVAEVAAPEPVFTQQVGDLSIGGAFSRATLPGAPTGGGYLSIRNTGTVDDRLVSASSPVAVTVQLHQMSLSGDVMTMRPTEDGLVIPAGQTVTLTPGGDHLMMMGLNQALVEGTEVTATLVFERAGPVEVKFAVAGMAADGIAAPAVHNH